MANRVYHSQYSIAQIAESIGKSPRINAQTKIWEIWDIETSAYVSTGIVAESASYAADAQAAAAAAEEDRAAAEDARDRAIEAAEEIDPDKFARVNGSYDGLGSAAAMQLDSLNRQSDSTPYSYRMAGGGVAGGVEYKEKLVGGTLVWNQLCPNGNFAVDSGWGFVRCTPTIDTANHTLQIVSTSDTSSPVVRLPSTQTEFVPVSGHVYFGTFDAKGAGRLGMSLDFDSISKNVVHSAVDLTGEWQTISGVVAYDAAVDGAIPGLRLASGASGWAVYDTAYIRNVMVIDLTLLFGVDFAGAAPTVEWFRSLFPVLPYSEYDTGSLESVRVSGHDTVGFNAWDEEWDVGSISTADGQNTSASDRIRSRNYIPVVPGKTYASSIHLGYTFAYDVDKRFLGTISLTDPLPDNCHYLRFRMTAAYGTTYKNDICINISGTRDGEYQPYAQHTYPLDSDLTLRGIPKLDANGSLYYDGDEYAPDGVVTRRYGIVNLGNLTWDKRSTSGQTHPRFIVTIDDLKKSTSSNAVAYHYILPGYAKEAASVLANQTDTHDMSAAISGSSAIFIVVDHRFTDVADFTAAMAGKYMVYELATPTTESAEPYAKTQLCDDYGSEEFVDAGVAAGTRPVAIPVGHETIYPENQVAKLDGLPNDFSTLIAPTEVRLVATRNYTTGQYLVVKNQLYKVTANIANGGTITPGTNVAATTIAEQLILLFNS